MNHLYSFEKLQVWNNARELVKITYKHTLKFPNVELYGLTNQMRRAAVSISSNISEGSGRTSTKDQAHFYQMVYSSLLELLSQYYVSLDLGYLNQNELTTVKHQIFMVSNKLNALRKAVMLKS
jgi:four helix bundle protein